LIAVVNIGEAFKKMKIKKLIISNLFCYYNVILSLNENKKDTSVNVYLCSVVKDNLRYWYCEPNKIFVGDGDEKDFFYNNILIDKRKYISMKIIYLLYQQYIYGEVSLGQLQQLSIGGSSGLLATFCALAIKHNKQVKNIFATGSYNELKLLPSMQEFLVSGVDDVKTLTKWENEYNKLKVAQDGILCKEDIEFTAVGAISEKLKNILHFIKVKKLNKNAIFLPKEQELDINYLIKELSSSDAISDYQLNRIQLNKGRYFIVNNLSPILKNVKREIVNNFFLHNIMKKNYIDVSNDQHLSMVKNFLMDEVFFDIDVSNDQHLSMVKNFLMNEVFFDIRYKKQNKISVDYKKDLEKQLHKEKKSLIKILQKINYVDSVTDLEKIKNIKTFNANEVPLLYDKLGMHFVAEFGEITPIEMYSMYYQQLLCEEECCIANEEELKNKLNNRLRGLYNEIMELVMHEGFSTDYNPFL
jgi:hypothetical protein